MSSEDPLRRLARERGHTLAELGVRPGDERWARQEAETIAGMVTQRLSVRLSLPAPLRRLLRRLSRAAR